MSFELIHTSVTKALRGGSGFATAVATECMPPGLEPVLVELSAFDVDPARATGADDVDWSHRIVTLQGRSYTVLSRTVPCGIEHTIRLNRVAHFLVVDASERSAAGPAWTLANFGQFASAVPTVEWRKTGPRIPAGSIGPRVPSNWSAAGFDPGWAGVLAASLLDGGGATIYLVLPGGCRVLGLIEDVFALLPEDRRWNVTFSTRFQKIPASVRCQLRCVRAGAPGVANLLAEPGCRKFVVTAGASAGEGLAAEEARAGRELAATTRTVSTRIEPVKMATAVHLDPPTSSAPAPRSSPSTSRTPSQPDLAGIARESATARRSTPRSDPPRSSISMGAIPVLDAVLFAIALLEIVAVVVVLAI